MTGEWEFSLPHGWGNETYVARRGENVYFVKLGVPLANYQVMASLGLTPPVLAFGGLNDGTSILVQAYVESRNPSWADFRFQLEQVAGIVRTLHTSLELGRTLAPTSTESYQELALLALERLHQKWQRYRHAVPQVAGWVDASLDTLARQVRSVDGAGVVAVHNDICNANWLITRQGRMYLIDLDAMSLDDPAVDLGALLWWYYPPELRGHFLTLAGYQETEALHHRMHLRMALHCLDILLPRQASFDRFDAKQFINSLGDYKAILANEENPRGFGDG